MRVRLSEKDGETSFWYLNVNICTFDGQEFTYSPDTREVYATMLGRLDEYSAKADDALAEEIEKKYGICH